MSLEPTDRITIDVVIKGRMTVRRDAYNAEEPDAPLYTNEQIIGIERDALENGWYSEFDVIDLCDNESVTIHFDLS